MNANDYRNERESMKITTSQDVLLAQIEMTEIANKYAHRMSMLLECIVMSTPSGTPFWDEAMEVLSKYRSEMNAIHERESPTFMGEPVLRHNAVVSGSSGGLPGQPSRGTR